MIPLEKFFNVMLKLLGSMFNSGKENVLISPLSLEILSYTILGAVGGKCYEELSSQLFRTDDVRLIPFDDLVEMVRCFRLSLVHFQVQLENVECQMANMVYLGKQFQANESYVQFVKSFLDTKVKSVDFADPQLNWCKMVCQDIGGIKCCQVCSLISKIKHEKMVSFNSFTYSGELKHKPCRAYEGTFAGDSVKYVVYRSTLKSSQNDVFFYVDLPYMSPGISLALFLPMPGKSIADVLAKLDYRSLSSILSISSHSEIEIHVPAVKLVSCFDMLPTIKHHFNINQIFDEKTADFSRMIEHGSGACLESIIMHAQLTLHESKIAMDNTSVAQTCNKKVIFDRPFLFLVNWDSRKLETLLLFSGVIKQAK